MIVLDSMEALGPPCCIDPETIRVWQSALAKFVMHTGCATEEIVAEADGIERC
jgi:hypothetical protein